MPKVKNSEIVSLRRTFKKMDPALEQTFLNGLNPELRSLYQASLANDWADLEQEMNLYLAASRVLFPQDRMPMRRLGIELAKQSYTTIYKLFLRVPSVDFVVKQAARIWKTYYDTGTLVIENSRPHALDIVVREFPDWPRPMREMAWGHYQVLLELTGAKNIKIVPNDADLAAWRWAVSWE